MDGAGAHAGDQKEEPATVPATKKKKADPDIGSA